MFTRRVIVLGLPCLFTAGPASAQTALLSANQREAILYAKALAVIQAARYAEFAPLFARCARSYASSDASRAQGLADIETAFTAAAIALNAAARAVPENLPAMPTLSRRDLAPVTTLPPRAARTAPQGQTATQRTAPLAPATARQTPNLAPNVATPAVTITSELIVLTTSEFPRQTRADAEAWARIAASLRDVARQTGIALAPAAGLFDAASHWLHEAAFAMLRARFEDATRESESDDRLGNFEIQDLMATANQSGTLASSVQKKLDDTASGIVRHIGG